MALNPGSNPAALVAAFEDRREAELAVDDLHQAGFAEDQVGYAIRGADVAEGGMITDEEGAKDGAGAAAGAIAGASAGAILGAAAALLIPGIGPVVAGGVLAMAIGGAAAGTAVGGIAGAISGLGVSEDEARFYETEFKSGRALVAVKAGARVADAAVILRRHGGYDLQARPGSEIPTEGVFNHP